jgi:ankyrin repeat protein
MARLHFYTFFLRISICRMIASQYIGLLTDSPLRMPKNNKKCERHVATVQSDDAFDDMLAEMRAADLTAPDAITSNTSSSISSSSRTMTSTIVARTVCKASFAGKAVEIPEERIIEAVKRGDIGQLHLWGRQGLRVTNGLPLAHAVGLGKLGIVQFLVRKLGADVNQADGEDCTPLSIAAGDGDLGIVRCLVKELGANVNQANVKGATSVYIAAYLNKFAVVQCLGKELGVDVNQATQNGTTPLYNAGQAGNMAMVQCLVKELGADINQGAFRGTTPLQIATHKGNLKLVRCLVLELHADVSKANQDGATPLLMIIAAQEGHLATVKVLVKDFRADINKSSLNGSTPLMGATSSKHTVIVKWLVKAGADTQASLNFEDTTAAHVSRNIGAPAEQTAYLEAKTHCSNFGCSGAGIKKCTSCKQARYCGEA